jgi:hypothetical protein
VELARRPDVGGAAADAVEHDVDDLLAGVARPGRSDLPEVLVQEPLEVRAPDPELGPVQERLTLRELGTDGRHPGVHLGMWLVHGRRLSPGAAAPGPRSGRSRDRRRRRSRRSGAGGKAGRELLVLELAGEPERLGDVHERLSHVVHRK